MMPILTIDIPEAQYASALRLLADLVDGATTTAPDADKGEEGLPMPWSFEELIPDDFSGGDIRRLIGLYKRLSVAGRRVLDVLELVGETHQDDLARRLGVVGASGLAGLMGHITKTAALVGRVSPVLRDSESKTYSLAPITGVALRQAALYAYFPTWDESAGHESGTAWILASDGDDQLFMDYDPVFVHRFPYGGQWWEISTDRPYRFIIFDGPVEKIEVIDGQVVPGLYGSRVEIAQEDQESFHDGAIGLEFFPDHDHKVLVGHSTQWFNELWPHDLGTQYAESTVPSAVEGGEMTPTVSDDQRPLHESFGAVPIGPPEEW
jgi:hypothetical protein